MIFIAAFLLSLSALAFEVLLARSFSIAQWNHLSFMVISIALFGFAASGTFLNSLNARQNDRSKRFATETWIKGVSVLYCIGEIAAFIIVNQIPLDYIRLPLEPIQTLYLLAAYLFLALPFFFTGLVVAVAYAYQPEKTGYIYLANMAGSACGAIFPLVLLPLCGEGKLVILSALIPLIVVFWPEPEQTARTISSTSILGRQRYVMPVLGLVICLIAGLITIAAGSLVKVKPSSYKAVSQMLQLPDTRITATTTGIRGRIDSVESPYIRFAPGLSLKYSNTLPGQWAALKDGDDPFVFYNRLHSATGQFAKFTLAYAGYLLAPDPESALLIQHGGGGLSIPCALAAGAKEITIVQEHPKIAGMIQGQNGVLVINRHPRNFLARSKKSFSIIHVESWGTSLPGSAALAQEHLFTIESFTQYLKHLKEDGVLIIARKLLLPPADSIRMWATAYESLKSVGIEKPEQHIAMLRNWDTFTLIVAVHPIQNTQVLKSFAQNNNFDLVYLQGLNSKEANRFNIFEAPFHFLEIKRLAQACRLGTAKDYYNTYLLDVAPQTDNRPFPNRYLKWRRLKALYKTTGSRFYSLFMSGEIVVLVVFAEALLVAALLLTVPLVAISKKSFRPSFASILYFLAVGAGFIFMELFFIKKYVFVFGDPVISFTLVLVGVLAFCGLGGYWSQRIDPQSLRLSLAALIVVLVIIFFGFDLLVRYIIGLSVIMRYLFAMVLLIPVGLLAGLPFSLGMRYLLKSPSERAYAWAANGCASVLASIAAAQIALSLGITAIIACGAAAYLLAFISAKIMSSRES